MSHVNTNFKPFFDLLYSRIRANTSVTAYVHQNSIHQFMKMPLTQLDLPGVNIYPTEDVTRNLNIGGSKYHTYTFTISINDYTNPDNLHLISIVDAVYDEVEELRKNSSAQAYIVDVMPARTRYDFAPWYENAMLTFATITVVAESEERD